MMGGMPTTLDTLGTCSMSSNTNATARKKGNNQSTPASHRPSRDSVTNHPSMGQTNNRIERMNGTLRERVKVQRGWKSTKTQLAEGQRIQSNFVKPHMALNGKTPAQAAGMGVQSRDKWMELLRSALLGAAAIKSD
jgi:Integrase core domain